MKDLKLVTYPYQKYGETVLAIQLEGHGNIQIADLSKVYTKNNSLAEYEKTRKQAEALGERIVLCVNNYEDLQSKLSTAEERIKELEKEEVKWTHTAQYKLSQHLQQRLASAEEIIERALEEKEVAHLSIGLIERAEQWLKVAESNKEGKE